MNEKQKAQLVKLVQMAMQGNQEAQQQIQQIMQFAQQGDPGAQQVAGLIQQIVQELQGQAPAKRQGGVLDYLKYLRGECPEGYEMQYFKNGGKAGCKKCRKALEGEKVMDPVEEFKCGRKMKKKASCGTKMQKAECGKKMKAKEGVKVPEAKCGKKVVNKSEQGDNTAKWENDDNGWQYYRKDTDKKRPVSASVDRTGRRTLLTPEGQQFTEKNVNQLDSALKANKVPSSPYKPQKKANGGTIDIFSPYRNLKINFNK